MRSLSIPGSTKKAGVLFLKQANSKVAPTALIHASVPACLCYPAISIPGPHSLRPFHSLLTSCRWKWVTTSVVRSLASPPPHYPSHPTWKAWHIILLIPPGRPCPAFAAASGVPLPLVLLAQPQGPSLSLQQVWVLSTPGPLHVLFLGLSNFSCS